MTRTACCFLALGISVSAFVAACGDDDGGGGGIGGNGGSGAGGGAGGSSGGSAGSAGEAGSGNIGGAGAGGVTGNGGDGGSAAGAAGSSAGTAGAGPEPDGGVPDSGIVDEPDSGVVDVPDAAGNGPPPDSGVNGDCDGFVTGIANIDAPNNQDVVIARVIFNDDDTTATVVLRVVAAAGFTFGGGQQLCWDAADEDCVEVDDGITGSPSPVNAELSVEIGTIDTPVTAAEGEVLFTNDFPSTNPGISFAYLNWGDHDSADPDGGGVINTLEELAGGFWTLGSSVALAGAQNAIFVNGDTTVDTGFGVCTADQF